MDTIKTATDTVVNKTIDGTGDEDTINTTTDTDVNETINGTGNDDTKYTATDTVVNETIDGTDGRYRWTQYHGTNVIEDTSNGYINATKLCTMYGKTRNGQPKHFTDWKHTNSKLIKYIGSVVDNNSELLYSIINGLDNIKGTYVHIELLPHIADWCGVDIRDNDIVQKCQLVKNELKRQKTAKNGYVYVLSAPMFSHYGSNVYKVGYTEDLKQRMRQFIGIPERRYVYTKEVDSMEYEQKTHALLCAFRLFDDHELFDAPLELIIEMINKVQIGNIRNNIFVPKDNCK